jgi:hypothetical protein
VNFADAFVCKRCSYQFQSYPQDAIQTYAYNQTAAATPTAASYNYSSSYQNQAESSFDSGAPVRKMVFGALWTIGGTIATVFSYSAASGGGKYFIFWGAIVFGVIDFLVGLNGYISSKD